jgi:ABC-type antimicrobial peptide transport system permease subunit
MKAPVQSSTIGINGLTFRVLCNSSVGGLIAALVLTRFSAHLLYAISPADPVTFTFITVLLFVVVLAAGYFPARLATKIDPMIALRSE